MAVTPVGRKGDYRSKCRSARARLSIFSLEGHGFAVAALEARLRTLQRGDIAPQGRRRRWAHARVHSQTEIDLRAEQLTRESACNFRSCAGPSKRCARTETAAG